MWVLDVALAEDGGQRATDGWAADHLDQLWHLGEHIPGQRVAAGLVRCEPPLLAPAVDGPVQRRIEIRRVQDAHPVDDELLQRCRGQRLRRRWRWRWGRARGARVRQRHMHLPESARPRLSGRGGGLHLARAAPRRRRTHSDRPRRAGRLLHGLWTTLLGPRVHVVALARSAGAGRAAYKQGFFKKQGNIPCFA